MKKKNVLVSKIKSSNFMSDIFDIFDARVIFQPMNFDLNTLKMELIEYWPPCNRVLICLRCTCTFTKHSSPNPHLSPKKFSLSLLFYISANLCLLHFWGGVICVVDPPPYKNNTDSQLSSMSKSKDCDFWTHLDTYSQFMKKCSLLSLVEKGLWFWSKGN